MKSVLLNGGLFPTALVRWKSVLNHVDMFESGFLRTENIPEIISVVTWRDSEFSLRCMLNASIHADMDGNADLPGFVAKRPQ